MRKRTVVVLAAGLIGLSAAALPGTVAAAEVSVAVTAAEEPGETGESEEAEESEASEEAASVLPFSEGGSVLSQQIGCRTGIWAGISSLTSTEALQLYLQQKGIAEDERVAQARSQYNEDIAAILNVGGEIERYVLDPPDNDYYLTHNEYREESINGAVFFDARCRYFPADTQVMIHGHNMKTGDVFGAINRYRSLSYLQEHPLTTLETLAGTRYYVPYAICDVNVDETADNYFLTIRWRFTPETFEEYTSYLIGESCYDIPVDVTYSDDLLTLSTCSYGYSEGRFLICLRRLRDDETPEQMSALVAAATGTGTAG